MSSTLYIQNSPSALIRKKILRGLSDVEKINSTLIATQNQSNNIKDTDPNTIDDNVVRRDSRRIKYAKLSTQKLKMLSLNNLISRLNSANTQQTSSSDMNDSENDILDDIMKKVT